MDILKMLLQSFFSALAEGIRKADTPESLRDLLPIFGRRRNTLGSAGADASFVSFLLGRLADFADEWENLEKEAEPRLPLNAINAAKTELERIDKAEADRVAALARHTIAMDTLRGEADSLERELASNNMV